MLPDHWSENANLLNQTVWWLFINKFSLDEAESLARKAIKLTQSPSEKANIKDTLTEILNENISLRLNISPKTLYCLKLLLALIKENQKNHNGMGIYPVRKIKTENR